MVFGLLWMLTLIDHTNKYIAMVSACTYYFDSNPQRDGHATVATGFKFAYMKNFGSLCYGSLIITIMKIIMNTLDAIAESFNSNLNPIGKCIYCCLRCCLRCIESLIEYLSKVAYAYMAVSGEGFCKSAWAGFLLNLKYLAKFYFAHGLAGLFVNLGIFMVAAVNVVIGWVFVTYVTKEAEDPTISMVGPYIAFVLLSFLIPIVCLSLFDEAITATLMCYSVDADLHGEEPRYGGVSYHEKLNAIKEMHEGGEREQEVPKQAEV